MGIDKLDVTTLEDVNRHALKRARGGGGGGDLVKAAEILAKRVDVVTEKVNEIIDHVDDGE